MIEPSLIHKRHFEEKRSVNELTVAYLLGELSEEDLSGIALAAEDETATAFYTGSSESISELTGLIVPAPPPPAAKERVMSRVREGSVIYYVPPPED